MVAHYGTAANLETRNGALFLHALAAYYSWAHPADCTGMGSRFLPDMFLRLCSPVPSLALQMFRLGLQAEKWDLGSWDHPWEHSARARVTGAALV